MKVAVDRHLEILTDTFLLLEEVCVLIHMSEDAASCLCLLSFQLTFFLNSHIQAKLFSCGGQRDIVL